MTTATRDPRIVHVSILEGSKQQAEVRIPGELHILEPGEEPTQSQNCLRFLTPEDGDKRVVWDRYNLEDIKAARKMFEDFQEKGIRIFAVSEDGGPVDEMKDFDAFAEEFLADDLGEITKEKGLDKPKGPTKQFVAMPEKRVVGG